MFLGIKEEWLNMKLGTRARIIRNENLIKKLKAENTEIRKGSFKYKVIGLRVKAEPDYEYDYMGICSCGCGKELYRGMTVLQVDNKMIYIECLNKYLNKNIMRF